MKWLIKTKGAIKELAFSGYLSMFNNLSDLSNKLEAVKNLGLFEYLVNVEQIKKIKILASTIKHNNRRRWMTQREKDSFNNKIDKLMVTNDKTKDFIYNQNEKRFYMKYDDKGRLFGGKIIPYKVGQSTFLGGSEEVRIEHKLVDANNIGVKPLYVSIRPLKNKALCGDVWVKKDNNYIYVGNSGAANIEFQYLIYAPKG